MCIRDRAQAEAAALAQAQAQAAQPEPELVGSPAAGPSIESWLAQVDLARYGPQIQEYGYDTLKVLRAATEADIIEMTEDSDVKMKKPHRRLFLAEWKKLLAES